jgi:hypothetical protein
LFFYFCVLVWIFKFFTQSYERYSLRRPVFIVFRPLSDVSVLSEPRAMV